MSCTVFLDSAEPIGQRCKATIAPFTTASKCATEGRDGLTTALPARHSCSSRALRTPLAARIVTAEAWREGSLKTISAMSRASALATLGLLKW